MQHKFTPTTHLKRAALTLLALILTCATAWADNDPVSYIAANGSTQTCTDYTVLHTGDNVSNLPGGWYVVSENVEFNSQLYFSGSASIILCDGKTLTVNSGNYNSINVNYALTIYGQSGQSGTLNATCNSGTNSPCIYARNDITINGGVVSVNGEIGIRGPVITINRGTVTSTGNLSGIWATNNVIINGGKVRATGDSYGVMANNNITLGWTNYSDFINANSYYAVDGSVAIATGKTLYDDATAYSGTLTSDQIQAIVGQTLCPYSTNDFTVNTDSTEYTIHTATGWDVFCDALQDNNTWNHFSGKTVKLGADISITQSAGSAGNEFMGTFDGDGKTLTVDITETTTQGTAPFREIKGATIQNLVVTGSVIGTIHAAGLVGFARGADASTVNTITNCKVATNVTVTTPNSAGNYHCGGVVGHAFHCTLNMSNTIYCGDITNSGNYVGGLQGWSDGNTINFSHCLFAGSYSGTTTGTASFHPVAVRYNNSATTANVSHVYYTVTPTLTNSNFIAADGTKTISRATAPATIGDLTQSLNFMSTTIYQYGICYNDLYYATIGLPSGGTDIYLIDNADDWLYFCEMLNDNATWNHFSGKTVKLGANITVTQMAGGSNHAFTGTFDGNHKTLTLNYGTVQAPIDAEFVAPFVEVSGGAEFINLNIDGHIYAAYTGSSDPGVGGLIGHLFGGITIEGCTSTVEINSTKDRVGGFVGLCEQAVTFTNCKSSAVVTCTGSGSGFVGWSRDSNYTIAFYGCLFNGKVLKKNGVGSGNGGFVGWKGYHKTVEITNCLVDPAAVAEGETMADDNSATFCRFSADTSLDNQATTITNCYYTETFGNAQGTQAYSISGGDYVTLANAGTVSNNYTTSGLIFYNAGLKYGDVLYAAANDEVSLTLAHQDREGYDFVGYTATAGNLNGSSLTMPDGNVTINAEYTYTAPSELTATDITFTTATLNWNGLQENYSVRYRTVGANEWQTIDNIAATTTTLSGLLSGTTYEWQVQGLDCDGNGGTTEWSATATFNTLSPCDVAPSELTATDITATTATLNWNGLQESYNVRYHPAIVIFNEGFESGTMPDGWTRTGSSQNVNYQWQVTSGTGYDDYTGAATGNYNAGCFIGNRNDSDILITPVMDLSNVASATLSFNFWNTDWLGDINILKVYYRVDEGEWQSLYTYSNATGGWIPVTINLEGMATNYQIGFECEGHWSYGMGIDDVKVTGINTSEWTTVTNVSSPHNLTGLMPETQYLWQVQGLDCNGEGSTTEWSVAGTFTTLSPCEVAPYELTATDITATTATLNWNGLQESYSVRYRTVGANEWQTIDNIAAATTTLSGLLSETTYEWQVQGLDCNSEGSTTEWSEAGTFTTPNPCEAPSELTATDITATTATLNWNGLQESYSVRYRPVILYEGFESGTMPDGWTRTNEYWEVTSGTGHLFHKGAATGNYNAGCYTSYSNDSDMLITPVMDLGNVASAILSFNFWNTNWDGDINILKVHYRVNGGEWHLLYTNSNETGGWIPVTINLQGMAANYQIGFECEGHYSYGMGIDDVMVTGINTSEWTTVTNVSSPHNLTGLTPETPYVWQVQGLDCNSEGSTTEWSEAGTFTTPPLPLPVSYIDENGETQQCTNYIWLTGTETTLGAEGQETWCVVHSTLDYSQGIQLLGNTHIILCDGAAMNIGSSESPVSGSSFQEKVGFYGSGNNLSLYAQSGNTGALTIYSQSCSFFVKDLTIAGGNVNATSLSDVPVIFCDNLTVRRSSLEVHANNYAAIQANNDVTLSNVTANLNSSNAVGLICSNFAVDNSQLTVNARYQAIEASNVITLSNVTANINSSNGDGLVCSNFAVDHSQLTVTALYQAIQASNVITLGCTAATDFIKATNTSSLTGSYSGTVKIADGQTLYAGTNAYTGTLTDAQRQAIGGQKLTNVAPPTYDYIDLDGTGATHTAVVIDADYMPTSLSGWYIVQGTVNYTNTINLAGDTHIILADNAVMNVTVTGYNYGIQSTSGNNYSLFVYGQTGQSGELNVTSNSIACFISGGDITIAGGKVTASGRIIGLYAQYTNNNGGNVTIKNATVTATGTSYFGILSEYGGNITIDNSNVTATSTGSSGIYAGNGNITIDNSNVTATSTGSSGIYAENGNITIASGTVTASGSSTQFGIYTVYGSVTINGGQVMATGNLGIYTVNGSVTINGGQVSAIGNTYGIYAQNSSDNITLGWTNPTDYIYVNKYYAGGTLSIAEGKTFIDEDGQTYSSTIAQVDGAYPIDGKTLYPYNENAVPYLDENGQQRYCVAYTTLTGTETELGTAGQETWYVVDSDVSFTDLTINGDIHLILVDGKTMNLNHEQGFVTLWGQANLTIYGQTNGTGTLSSLGLISAMNITINGGIINVKGDGFFKEENFIPAIWCLGDMVINGGKVYAQGDMGIVVASMGAKSDDMTTYNFTLNGGQVTAIGISTDMGIIATGNITLGWTNPTDYIYANKYYAEGTLSIASSKTFVDENNTSYSGTIAQVAGAYAIDGKTLYPDCVVMKQVAGYEEGNGGWVFIASPVAENIAPSEVHNLFPSADETTDDYDLYHFNQAAELEWENWKATATGNDPDFTTLVNGQGYLYATKNTKTLVFTGPFITDAESVAVGLEYDATDDHKCWNLVGNPFADTAYVDHDFYVMNALGSEIIAAERDYVNPMEGIFVKAEGEYDDTMIFSLQAPCKGQSSKPKHEQMVINLSRDRGPSTGSGTTIIDRAIVRMGEGQTQPKFQINRNSTKLYIPQGGTDYAIITSNGQGELPLNFKAETDGTYTLSFNAEEVGFSYLHLIDNMTGADVDLLPLLRGQGGLNQPATYTFTAKTTDYESRFKLVFSTNDAGDTSTGLETEGSEPDDVRTQKMVIR